MAKSKNKKAILYPVFFMILVTAIFTASLSYVNAISKDRIKAISDLKLKTSVLYVLGKDTNLSADDINASFDSLVTETTIDGLKAYTAKSGDTVEGYVYTISGPGLWGSIRALIAVSADFKEIIGISFLAHSETPGLGGRIDEDWFKEQFRNVPINGTDTVIYKPKEGGTVDSISGATATSEAVRKLVNNNLEDALKKLGGAK